jgi:hypothetical protein
MPKAAPFFLVIFSQGQACAQDHKLLPEIATRLAAASRK